MTAEQIVKFKEDFKSIICIKGKLTEQRTYLNRLYQWDKNNSHENSINKGLERLEQINNSFKERLYEYKLDYESMKVLSKKISEIESKIKIKEKELQKLKTNLDKL